MAEHERSVLLKEDYCVLPVPRATGRRLIRLHHYARSAPSAAVYVHGLFARSDSLDCLGVAWWLPPPLFAARTAWSGDPAQVLALSRLVVVPGAPRNAATFLLARSVGLIHKDGRYRCLLTYADTAQGHTGAIYRAANWEHLGLVVGHQTWVSADGSLVSEKTWSGTRPRVQLEAMACTAQGAWPKHKYRMILEPGRPPRTLFDRLRAPQAQGEEGDG